MHALPRPCLASKACLGIAALACVLLAAACAPISSAPEASNNPAAGCVDDSKHCIDKRMSTLKTMVSDQRRSWVYQQESPASYATGVKLFAYRATKAQLDMRRALAWSERDGRRGALAQVGLGPGHERQPARAGARYELAGQQGARPGVRQGLQVADRGQEGLRGARR